MTLFLIVSSTVPSHISYIICVYCIIPEFLQLWSNVFLTVLLKRRSFSATREQLCRMTNQEGALETSAWSGFRGSIPAAVQYALLLNG